jgi:hypothetical protein
MALFSWFPSGITAAFGLLLIAVLPIRAEVSNMAPVPARTSAIRRHQGGAVVRI